MLGRCQHAITSECTALRVPMITTLLTVKISKALEKVGGGQACPKCPTSYDPVLHVLYEIIATVLVSDVKPPCQTMLAISTVSVTPAAVSPPTTMSLL